MWFTIFASCIIAAALAHNGHDHSHDNTHSTEMQSSSEQIKLSIYYESFCPDSIKFFKDQLLPVYKELKSYLDIDFIPFGKSTQWYDTKFEFDCHHGSKECYGNIVHGCANKFLFTEEDKIEYLGCLMTTVDTKLNNNESYPLSSCGDKYTLAVGNIKKCVEGDQGLMILSENGNKTAKLPTKLQNVPAVAVNMTYNLQEQSKLTTELKSVVCSLLKPNNPKLEACSFSSVAATTSSFILITIASIFVANIIS